MKVVTLLATGSERELVAYGLRLMSAANFIESRENRNDRSRTTVMHTVWAESLEPFVVAASANGVTLEEVVSGPPGEVIASGPLPGVEGATYTQRETNETYRLLTGEPGTGWSNAST